MTQQATNLVANGSTTAITTRGKVFVIANGTWGSGSLVLEVQDPSDAWHTITTALTADGYIEVLLPEREVVDIRTTLSGATAPDIDVFILADEAY
jgi:hypothetical protein